MCTQPGTVAGTGPDPTAAGTSGLPIAVSDQPSCRLCQDVTGTSTSSVAADLHRGATGHDLGAPSLLEGAVAAPGGTLKTSRDVD
ncbi:hypothetical protein GCM10022225_05210 [Plantactinospora mayteni]|uniref:Uncharacterized protein n=1 Tax=Plantactinospora mayteni TaxID=566021 RepID=A0ABQ4EQW8_9ACTN|nr:hypothetical protein Pma05_35830 [Plantactinospora mayteni]